MDEDTIHSMLAGHIDALLIWHRDLGREMTRDEIREMYAGRPHVLLMDANSSVRHIVNKCERLAIEVEKTKSRAVHRTASAALN